MNRRGSLPWLMEEQVHKQDDSDRQKEAAILS
jgi:hypothetical protein